jgi:hypothetical protein
VSWGVRANIVASTVTIYHDGSVKAPDLAVAVNSSGAFAEIEENEFELDKLTRWLPKIDFFSAKLGPKARTALKACTADFNRYCKEVSEREVPPDSENLAPIPSKKRR